MSSEHDEYDDDDDVQDTDGFTSIWDLVPGYTQSPLDSMLDKEETTLEQVLDEDTLIQELKSANQKVIGFLSQDNNLNQIVNYLSSEATTENTTPVDKMSEEEIRTHFKYPYVISEVIGCEVDEICEGILTQERIQKLLSYLSNKKPDQTPVNASQSQYFIRSLQELLQKYYKAISQIIVASVPLDIFIEHIGICDMDSLFLRLLGYEADNDSFDDGFSAFATQQRIRELFMAKQRGNDSELQEKKNAVRNWALENNLLDLLIQKLVAPDEDVQRNVFNLLSELIEKGKSPIADRILSEDFIGRVVDVMLNNSESSVFTHGIGFLRTVLDFEDERQQQQQPNEEAKKAIIARTDSFTALLKKENQKSLGETRLKTVEHLYTLYKLRIEQVLTDVQVINNLLDLFFEFAFNNMLHCNVFAILQIILESDRDELKLQVIKETNLLKRLLDAHEANEAALKEPKGFRKGYMGFVVELSNMIRKLSTNEEQPIGAYAKEVTGWTEYVNGPLNERNVMNERQMGGPIPIGSQYPSNLYQFDDDDDDDEYAYDDDDDSDDDDDDDEEVIRRTPEEEEARNRAVFHTDIDLQEPTNPDDDFEADFNSEFV